MLNYKRIRLLLCNTLMGVTLCTALPVRAGFLDAFRSPISNEIMVDALIAATARAATLGAAGAGALYGMYRFGTVRRAAEQLASGAQPASVDGAAAGSAPVGPVVAGSVILPGACIDADDRALLEAVVPRPLRRINSWPSVTVRKEELAEHGQQGGAGGSVRGGVLGAVQRCDERLRLLVDEDGDSSSLEIEIDNASERGNLSSGSSVDGESVVAAPGQEQQQLAAPEPAAAVVAQGQPSAQTTPLEAAVGFGLSCLGRLVRPVASRTMSCAASVLGRGNNGNDAASVTTGVSGGESAPAGSVPADRGGAEAQVQAAAVGAGGARGGGGGDQEVSIELLIEAICRPQTDKDTAWSIFDQYKARLCAECSGVSEQQVWQELNHERAVRAVRQFFFEHCESITKQKFIEVAQQFIHANIVTREECCVIYDELIRAGRITVECSVSQ